MTAAEELFHQVFNRWLGATALISNFRSTFTAVASSASAHLEANATEVFRRMHEDPELKGILVDIKTGQPATADCR